MKNIGPKRATKKKVKKNKIFSDQPTHVSAPKGQCNKFLFYAQCKAMKHEIN